MINKDGFVLKLAVVTEEKIVGYHPLLGFESAFAFQCDDMHVRTYLDSIKYIQILVENVETTKVEDVPHTFTQEIRHTGGVVTLNNFFEEARLQSNYWLKLLPHHAKFTINVFLASDSVFTETTQQINFR